MLGLSFGCKSLIQLKNSDTTQPNKETCLLHTNIEFKTVKSSKLQQQQKISAL